MTQLEQIRKAVDEYKDEAVGLAKDIWGYAELAFEESRSSRALIDALKKHGFEIEEGIAEIPTAFTATYKRGSGKPVMATLAEYDALDGLNQRCGIPEKSAEEPGKPGHGCGHNLLGTGCFLAAVALKKYMDDNDLDGTIIFFGCPAEEGAGSKQFIARAGYFDDVDIVYTWHPGNLNRVQSSADSAIMGANFIFDGVASHAGATPYLGRSALDGAELMNVGCNYLREHIIDKARIHYAYSDAGGTAPNVVQAHSVIKYEVRAPKVKQMQEIFNRVVDVAKGAAMMTGTRMHYDITMAFSDNTPNTVLAAKLDEAFRECGAPDWSEDDYELALKFLRTYSKDMQRDIRESLEGLYEPDEIDAVMERPLDCKVHPFDPKSLQINSGSTDVGDVAYAAPTVVLNVATFCVGNVGHSWQSTALSGSQIGMKGMVKAGEVMALAFAKTMNAPETIKAAKAELLKKNGGGYKCPLPDYVKPPIGTY